ncbi:MAG TPA: DUF2092 domain-containing protein [Candidatus Cybelea sp.]|nr:DUF2092 domain-containing protein [Candidatus Cybelea sp.]
MAQPSKPTKPKILTICLALALTIVGIASFPILGKTPSPKSGTAGNRAGPAADQRIDPDAIAILNKMGGYLRSLKAFQIHSVTRREDVLDDGEKIEYDGVVDLLARQPDRLRIEVDNDRQHRLYLYDGKTFTLWAERVNYYATVAAPPTIGQLSDELYSKFGIDVPLGDLFLWGTPRSKVDEITAATDIGPSPVEETTCEQYAFRQAGLDWQIWIQQGDFPLPRKFVITTLTDDARPQYSAVLTWSLAPSFDEAAFTFDPPKGAQKIVFAGVRSSPSNER